MRLDILCDSLGLLLPGGADKIEINNVRSNSKEVHSGDLFVCVNGFFTDGHKYVKEAEKNGAAAIISQKEIETDLPLLICENTRKILPHLYSAICFHPEKKLKIVGVTGTNGKTTVTYLLEAIFMHAGYRTGVIGTIESRIDGKKIDLDDLQLKNMTTPDPEELFLILSYMAKNGVEYVFMEVSSHALALDKLDGIIFECGVFTNLTPEHMDFHRDMEDYFGAKRKLFDISKIKIVNVDDAFGKRLRALYMDCDSCSALGENADFMAKNAVSLGVLGTEWELMSDSSYFKIKSRLVGEYNIMNVLEASACALSLGVPPSKIRDAIGSVSGVKGRLERVRLDSSCDFSVFIDFAHTPDALKKVLLTLRENMSRGERLVVLFGCGGDRDRSKRRVMGEIASDYADLLIVTSDNSRSEEPMEIISEIEKGIYKENYTVIENRREAIEYAILNAKRGDVILLAGKGHEEYEINKSGKHPFCEKDIVKEAFLRRK